MKKICEGIVSDFDTLPIHEDLVKPRVGVVGEILVKYMPLANNRIVELLEREGAEAVVPDLIDFMLYCFYNQIYKAENLGTSKKAARLSAFGIWAGSSSSRDSSTGRPAASTPPSLTPIPAITASPLRTRWAPPLS